MISGIDGAGRTNFYRALFVFIILITFPCYCLGFVWLAASPDPNAPTATPTLENGEATWTPIGGDLAGSPTWTPLQVGTTTPLATLAATPWQFLPATQAPIIINTPFPTLFIPQPTLAPTLTQVMDSDGDGVPDHLDVCPNVPGIPSNNGCPPIDTDGDGIPDSQDQCPNVPGIPLLNGCPNPTSTTAPLATVTKTMTPTLTLTPGGSGGTDTDNDGIPDDQDQCPTEPGIPLLNGCPENP